MLFSIALLNGIRTWHNHLRFNNWSGNQSQKIKTKENNTFEKVAINYRQEDCPTAKERLKGLELP